MFSEKNILLKFGKHLNQMKLKVVRIWIKSLPLKHPWATLKLTLPCIGEFDSHVFIYNWGHWDYRDKCKYEKRREASSVIVLIRSFEFMFFVRLMRDILGLTFELSQLLQKKDQDTINAIELVQISKKQLQDIELMDGILSWWSFFVFH